MGVMVYEPLRQVTEEAGQLLELHSIVRVDPLCV